MDRRLAVAKHATHFIRDNRCDEWVSDKFLAWLDTNLDNWNKFVEVCNSARKRGYTKWSARAAMDVVRWELGGTDKVKFSNSITPEMGRLYNHLYCKGEAFLRVRPLSKTRA